MPGPQGLLPVDPEDPDLEGEVRLPWRGLGYSARGLRSTFPEERETASLLGVGGQVRCNKSWTWQWALLAATLVALAGLGIFAAQPKAAERANLEQRLGFYLPNLGHPDPNGGWMADTWDHFQLPLCDPGPPPGTMHQANVTVKEHEWVNKSKGEWVPGMWYLDKKEENGGHWVSGHYEKGIPGHFVSVPHQELKWVPLEKTPEQLDCANRQAQAAAYHEKLIYQHKGFTTIVKETEDLLRWQGEHQCPRQKVGVELSGEGEKEDKGKSSSALCQVLATQQGYDGFTWSVDKGCFLQTGAGPEKRSPGALSGKSCLQSTTYLPWISDEAQRHTLYDQMTPTPAPYAGFDASVLCVMLIDPYSTDLDLVDKQHEARAGIFACDKYAVYSAQLLEFPSGLKTRKIYASQLVEKGGQWNVDLTTDVSMALWREVLKDPEWREVKWTVRAYPDCVFMLSNLRKLLHQEESYGNVNQQPTYLASTGNSGFPSFLQVMSQGALKSLAEKSRECFWQMRFWGDTQWHDAMWIDQCLQQTVQARRAKYTQLVNDGGGINSCESFVGTYPVPSWEQQRQCYMT